MKVIALALTMLAACGDDDDTTRDVVLATDTTSATEVAPDTMTAPDTAPAQDTEPATETIAVTETVAEVEIEAPTCITATPQTTCNGLDSCFLWELLERDAQAGETKLTWRITNQCDVPMTLARFVVSPGATLSNAAGTYTSPFARNYTVTLGASDCPSVTFTSNGLPSNESDLFVVRIGGGLESATLQNDALAGEHQGLYAATIDCTF